MKAQFNTSERTVMTAIAATGYPCHVKIDSDAGPMLAPIVAWVLAPEVDDHGQTHTTVVEPVFLFQGQAHTLTGFRRDHGGTADLSIEPS